MRRKYLLLLTFLLTLFILHSNDGKYSVVYVKKDYYLKLYKDYKNVFSAEAEIPADYTGLITTWETAEYNKKNFLRVKYKEKTGWVNRKYLTSQNVTINTEMQEVEKKLINLTASIQQLDFQLVDKVINSLRGMAFYYNDQRFIKTYTKSKLKSDWKYILSKKYTSGTNINYLFNDLIEVLESKFDINFTSDKHSMLPVELSNFKYIALIGERYEVLVGVEFFNKIPFFSYISVFKK